MIKKNLEFFVGLFFLLGLISLFVLIFKLTDVKNMYHKNKTYKIKAVFKNIGNLKENAKVTIGGVKIGIVNKIELKENNLHEYYPEIEMYINSNISRIPIDSSANILMSNLLGDSYIQLELGNDDTFIKNGDYIILTTQALIIEELISKFTFEKNIK